MNIIPLACSSALLRLLTAGIAVLLSCANQVTAAPPTIVASASKRMVQVAEPFTVEWMVTTTAGAKVSFPSIGDKLGDFDVSETVERFDIPSVNAVDTRTWTRRSKLESIVTGEQTIPAMEFQISDGSDTQVVQSNPVTINVASVLEDRGDPTKFRDIQTVLDAELPVTHSRAWIWWSAGAVAAVSLLAIAAVTVARHRRSMTPRTLALKELDLLESLVAKESLESEVAAGKLSAILCSYLHQEFSIDELGHTPEELLRSIDANNTIGAAATNRLREIFSLAEHAKFAGQNVSSRQLTSDISVARGLVIQFERNKHV